MRHTNIYVDIWIDNSKYSSIWFILLQMKLWAVIWTTVNRKKLSWNTIFRLRTFWNFILSKSIILVKDLIRQKEGFEIYLIDHYAVVIGNKNIAGRYIYIFCISVIHPRLGESVHTGWYIYNSLIHIIHYLSACNKGLLIET